MLSEIKMGAELVSSFRHMVRVSCDGYEIRLMELFEALEKDRALVSRKSPSRSGGKLVREMKSLMSTINYEGSVSRKSRKGGKASSGC